MIQSDCSVLFDPPDRLRIATTTDTSFPLSCDKARISTRMQKVSSIDINRRSELEPLLNKYKVEDAMVAYYALDHPADKTRLFGYFGSGEKPTDFLVIAQTGFDLFRPLVVPFISDRRALKYLIQTAMSTQRNYLVTITLDQSDILESVVDVTEPRVNEIHRLDLAFYDRVMNILAVRNENSSGWPRYEITSRKGGFAAAGVNWLSSHAAEIYTDADEEGRNRGFVTSVLSHIIEELMSEDRMILHRLDVEDARGYMDAFSVGFRPTGVRTLISQIVHTPSPGDKGALS